MKTAIAGAVILTLALGGHVRAAEAASSQAVVSDGSHAVLTVAHFARIQKFILDEGKRQTYCNMFNHNPYWKFADFNAYLNPPNQGNINCEIGKSPFDILVIQVTKRGPNYFKYWHVALDRATNSLRLQQHNARSEPKALIEETSQFFEAALKEIDTLAQDESSSSKATASQMPAEPLLAAKQFLTVEELVESLGIPDDVTLSYDYERSVGVKPQGKFPVHALDSRWRSPLATVIIGDYDTISEKSYLSKTSPSNSHFHYDQAGSRSYASVSRDKGDDIVCCQIHFSTSDKRWDVAISVSASDDRLNRVVAFAKRLDAVLTEKVRPRVASAHAAQQPLRGPDVKYPHGYAPTKAEEERRQAPFGRTPGGSALDPGIPGHPNPEFRKFVKPKPYFGIDPNDHDQSYRSYGIPKNAVKGTPFRDRGDDADTIDYLAPVTHDLLAKERVLPKTHQVIQRDLFKGYSGSHPILHGIQREWYDNGKPKSEKPYKNGIMHGLFKERDELGNLVACYKIINGAGFEQVYYSNGRLKREAAYRENRKNGPYFEFYKNGQMSCFTDELDGRPVGLGVSYSPNGQIADLCHNDEDGAYGPYVRFSPEGAVEGDVKYFVRGEMVTREQYLAQTKIDPRLPKVENDPLMYKKWEDKRIKRIVEHYYKVAPVNIPLECQDEGEANDNDLSAAAQKVRAANPGGGEYLWTGLKLLVKPGMSVRQLKRVLPPQHNVPGIVERNDQKLFLHYPLDDSFSAEAEGTDRQSADDSILTDYPEIVANLDLTIVEGQALSLLSRLRGQTEADKAASAADAVALARQLQSRQVRHGFVSSPSKVRDVGPSLAALHAKAARRCRDLAAELLRTVYAVLPKSQAAAEAVFLLAHEAAKDQQWERCLRLCNVLLKEYPQAGMPEVVGKRHQFSTYCMLGAAQAKLGQSAAAAESFAQSLLSAEAPLYHIVGWKNLLAYDARLASSDVMAKVMPRVQAEFARREAAAGLRVRLSRVPPATAPAGTASPAGDNAPIVIRVTVECPGGDRLRGQAIPDFRVSVLACPPKPDPRDNVLQLPVPPPPVWSSDTMTLAPGQSITKQFTIPGEELYLDRPVALLTELSAEKLRTNDARSPANLDTPWYSWSLPYWSQPLLLDYPSAPGAQPAETSPSKP
jgi:antitoxin component YwqK of YwqJK toxin-antitoxin module